jgi:hypothetical protein
MFTNNSLGLWEREFKVRLVVVGATMSGVSAPQAMGKGSSKLGLCCGAAMSGPGAMGEGGKP